MGPGGLYPDPARGKVSWLPAVDQLGPTNITLSEIDPRGGIAEQSFMINVHSVGGPPAITSVPQTQSAVGLAYLYSVIATDAEVDPLSFSLLAHPSGMTINANTGEIAWTPSTNQIGLSNVIIQVSDGAGGFATQAFSVQVAAGVANQPPTFINTAPLYASVGAPLTYQLTASDPEGSGITYQLRRGPSGISVNATTGQVTWTPTLSDIGTHIIAFAALDAQGAAAVLSFELEVLAANIAPVIHSLPPTKVTARSIYRYDAIASDQNLDPLSYQLINAPAGMTVDTFGRIRWQTEMGDLGNHSATLRVTDPRGGAMEQMIQFVVVPDTVPPRVTIIPAQNIVRANSPEVYIKFNLTPVYPTNLVRVSAVDAVGIVSVKVTANGKPVSLDANGYANFSFRDWGYGSITVVATGVDAAGNMGTGAKRGAFRQVGDGPSGRTIHEYR